MAWRVASHSSDWSSSPGGIGAETGMIVPLGQWALEAGLAETGRKVEDLELLILTHQHYDHFGLAGALRERSGARVAAHALLAEFVADFVASMDAEDAYAAEVMSLHGVEPDVSAQLQDNSRKYRRYGSSVEVETVLHEGDSIVAGGPEPRPSGPWSSRTRSRSSPVSPTRPT